MNALVLVARREFAEKKSWFWAAAVAAVLVVAIPHVAGVAEGSRAETTALIGWIFGGIFAVSLAIHFGLSLFVGPSVERRAGFYFARPVSSLSLWAGKVTGGWLFTVLFCAVLVAPPVLVSIAGGFDPVRAIAGGGTMDSAGAWFVGSMVVGILLVIGLIHLLGAAIRSGSPVAILDLMALSATAGLVWWTANTLVGAGAGTVLGLLAALVAAVTGVAILAAGAAQVTVGRADLRRGHLAQSKLLWGILLPAAVLLALHGRWFVSPSIADLRGARWVEAAPAGDWMTVLGPVDGRRGWEASFLVNGASGGELADPPRLGSWIDPAFSADGRHAIWLAGRSPWETKRGKEQAMAQLVLADLSGAAPKLTWIPWYYRATDDWSPLVLSGDGSRFAVLAFGGVTVCSLPDAKMLGSFRLPAGLVPQRGRARFLDADRLRLFVPEELPKSPGMPANASVGSSLRIFDLDLSAKTVTELGGGGAWAAPAILGRLDASGDRLLLPGFERPRALALVDATSGRELARLGEGPIEDGNRRGMILSDGRVVVLEARPEGTSVRLFDRDGAPVREIALPGAKGGTLGGEPVAGKVWVGRSPDASGWERENDGKGWVLHLVDLEAGEAREVGRDLVPIRRRANFTGGMEPPAVPGSLASSLARSAGGSLVKLAPDGTVAQVLVAAASTAK